MSLKYYTTRKVLLILVLFPFNLCLSQNETNNWYFGDKAGLNFSNGQTSILTNGNINAPAGCSSISDRDGNLLFYTNGKTVWNKNHALMNNGDDLAGIIGETQTSIIIPSPTNNNKYYLFTTRGTSPSINALGTGVYYSEIEFTNQNPLGSVVLKNVKLTQTSSERITAIHDSENNSIKVIAFCTFGQQTQTPYNTFFIFNVDSNGVTSSSTSTVNEVTVSKAGTMKISPNGEYIAIADNASERIYLYNFNITNSSITFSNAINTGLFLVPIKPYGLEFTADSKILYFTGSTSTTNYLYKYIITTAETFNDKILIALSNSYKYGSLQLARNGKIYISNYSGDNELTSSNSISVLNEPENLTADSGFEPLSINLSTGNSFKGLPNFIQSYFRNRIIAKNACINDPFEFNLDAYTQIQSVFWEFGDGNTSTLMSPTHQYTIAGEYIVKATIEIDNYPTVLYKKITAYPLPTLNINETLVQCDADNDSRANFNLYTIEERLNNISESYEMTFYNSLNDANNNTNPITNPESYENTTNPQQIFVEIITEEGCPSLSSFNIEATYTELGNISNMYACDDSDGISNNNEGLFSLRQKLDSIRSQFNVPQTSTITFYESFEDAQSTNNSLQLNYITETTTIWVRIENEDYSCSGIEPIQLIVNVVSIQNIQDEYTICEASLQPPIILDGGVSNNIWEWRNGAGELISTQREFQLIEPGNFSLTVFKTENNLQCSTSKNFTVYNYGIVTFDEIIADDFQIYVSVEGQSSYEFSLDNVNFFGSGTAHTFLNVEAGIYTIYVKDIDNCELPINTNTSIIGFPKYFTPNNDGVNDTWKIKGITEDLYSAANINIYNRYGNLLFSMDIDDNYIGWDGTYNGEILNSTDYWFKAILTDRENNIITRTGHFTLKY